MAESRTPLLDVRPEADFRAGHAPGAVGIPLEELARRVHELPSPQQRLSITDADASRLARAVQFLRRRGHDVVEKCWDPSLASESGPSRTRLWRPNPFLVECLPIIRLRSPQTGGKALDVACGSGRDAVFLAGNGYEVVALDRLPDALERASELARGQGVSLQTVTVDLEADAFRSMGTFDLVTVFRYLHRPLFPSLRAAIKPGGYVVYETFHEMNRKTGRRPLHPNHLLKSDELAAAFAGFEILVARDAVERDGRFFSSLLARKPE